MLYKDMSGILCFKSRVIMPKVPSSGGHHYTPPPSGPEKSPWIETTSIITKVVLTVFTVLLFGIYWAWKSYQGSLKEKDVSPEPPLTSDTDKADHAFGSRVGRPSITGKGQAKGEILKGGKSRKIKGGRKQKDGMQVPNSKSNSSPSPAGSDKSAEEAEKKEIEEIRMIEQEWQKPWADFLEDHPEAKNHFSAESLKSPFTLFDIDPLQFNNDNFNQKYRDKMRSWLKSGTPEMQKFLNAAKDFIRNKKPEWH